jgi:hypothetical protein
LEKGTVLGFSASRSLELGIAGERRESEFVEGERSDG